MTSAPGDAAPDTPRTFASLGLGDAVLKALDEMGWDEPTPVQAESYAPIVSGRDVVVQARTGTGKTGAFGIPMVDRLVKEEPGVQALVLAPTRELALQSAREIAKLGAHKELSTTAVYGGAPMERQVRELKEGAQIVSGTPGRVLDHLRRGTMDTSKLAVLVLDEADEMLSMGFAKELNAILELLPKSRQTLLYSATVDGPVMRVGERHMKDPLKLELSGDAVGALTVTHYAYMVSGKGRAKDLVSILEVEDPESAIVFCNTKVETERVAAHLQAQGFSAEWLNGDLPQGEREKVMAKTREGKCRYLVATDVAARGIDISHLTHVINFSLPDHLEQYIHRTGRTGRAGRTGTALTLVAPQEIGQLYYLRLQYKIFPVERTLPSAGEAQTRREMDRVGLLAAAFTGATSEIDAAVARRLLTHPEAERLVAGLLGAFFGTEAETEEEVDDLAAAARRERPAPPAPEPAPETPEAAEAA
ncbi:MAG: DEAD/DEAH box helicase, partial [Myxococcota bacterium]